MDWGLLAYSCVPTLMGLTTWAFRGQLTDFSDAFYGITRTPESRKRYANRLAATTLAVSVCMSVAVLLFT